MQASTMRQFARSMGATGIVSVGRTRARARGAWFTTTRAAFGRNDNDDDDDDDDGEKERKRSSLFDAAFSDERKVERTKALKDELKRGVFWEVRDLRENKGKPFMA